MVEYMKIGLIQPVINPDVSWNYRDDNSGIPICSLNIDPLLAEKVWDEIKEGLRLMLYSDDKPDVILIPELHLPIFRIEEIKRISKKYNVLIISGIDFQRSKTDLTKIRNRGIITIPSSFGQKTISPRLTSLYFGKTYFTYMEKSMFKNIEGIECCEDQEQNMYIFQSSQFGSFGIMICSDIFDIERMMLYQTRIQHLFVISLNKDLNTYFSMADTLTRLLYCNVVVCNTGYYGGSIVVSPFKDVNERLIYKYQGQRMFNVNTVSIPVSGLVKAQRLDYSIHNSNLIFKASPPGYFDKISK